MYIYFCLQQIQVAGAVGIYIRIYMFRIKTTSLYVDTLVYQVKTTILLPREVTFGYLVPKVVT